MKIVSASRRGDMVAFHSALLRKKYREMGRNCFWVFWTKNPENLLDMDLDSHRSALQLTVTGLGGTCLEPGVPEYRQVLEATERVVSAGFRPELINWRYDPIIPGHSDPRTLKELAKFFSEIGVTRCVTSFVTWYSHVKERWPEGAESQVGKPREKEIASRVRDILAKYDIHLYGCAQPHLQGIVTPSKCIDGDYYSSVTGFEFDNEKDPLQRKTCGCTNSVDIGKYGPCPHRCVYCYVALATTEEKKEDQTSMF